MLKSLYSAVSGLNIHQTEMDVIGNNIANVNTNGYKNSSVNFSDVLYQTTSGGTGPSENRGAVSPKQVGLGGMVASIDVHLNVQGPAMIDGGQFSMMINGYNFFVVNGDDNTYYTRDGSFKLDVEGNLVNNQGYYVMGWLSNNGAPINTENELSPIDLATPQLETSPGVATTRLHATGNIDQTDPQLEKGRGMLASVYNAAGEQFNLRFTLTDAADEDAGTYDLVLNGMSTSDGEKIDMAETTYRMVFDKGNGNLISAGGNANGQVNITIPGAAGGGTVTLDLSAMKNYNHGGMTNMNIARGDEEGQGAGRLTGNLKGYSVSKGGIITAEYTNGENRIVAQIATARFTNMSGLLSEGDNLYSATRASGEAQLMAVDEDGGSISQGVLEGSNVDLSDEFTRMITAQRAFQANSRVITTSDQMLQELKTLKSS
ncbi:flagellar hook protein FlgE [Butyrivibrio sp. MC2013]|uniref:flagellar hook protein FlgE n=1 Tax=Butyrivibrio sp. MC2013 TaxID=1280686 RepID=UPI0004257A5D|nr:flagellar hook protein FlgE [Butyrivibrio sp. MC2013]